MLAGVGQGLDVSLFCFSSCFLVFVLYSLFRPELVFLFEVLKESTYYRGKNGIVA